MRKPRNDSKSSVRSAQGQDSSASADKPKIGHGPLGRRISRGPAVTVPPGHHVSGKDGKLRIIESHTGNVYRELGDIHEKPAAATTTSDAPLPDNGWIVNAGWSNTSAQPIAYFSTTWVVPPVPSNTTDNEIVYLFNGLEQGGSGASPNGPFILQPVLQWGVDTSEGNGGAYWTISNQYVGSTTASAVSSLVQVNPGDVLQGVMTLTGSSASGYSYTSKFIGYPAADLTVTDIQQLTWACETLECYNISQCADYPNTPMTPFYDIELKIGDSVATATEATLNWSTEVLSNDCGQGIEVVSNDSPGGAVYIYYAQPTPELYFIVDKGTYGLNEVKDAVTQGAGKGVFPAAFWVALEGFTPQQVLIDQPSIVQPTIGGTFHGLTGVKVTPSTTYSPSYDATQPYAIQRILYPFDVVFDATSYNDFPGNGETPESINANITVGSTALPQAVAEFFLVSGADPYFTNVNPAQNNVFYLSQDIRVFTVTPTAGGATPIGNVPFNFTSGSPTALDPAAGYDYVQSMLAYLNTNYANPSGQDPFASFLPDQGGALTGDSSVTENTPNPADKNAPFYNYNYAIARVRMQGAPGSAGDADNVRVFFRMFGTQTNDTDYINVPQGVSAGDPYITFPSTPVNSPNDPTAPLPGTDKNGTINGSSIPFFAAADQSDLSPGGANCRTIDIPTGQDGVWTYFGSFLNIYDPTYLTGGQDTQSWFKGGTHHCLVAQIAYDDAPIENQNGVIENPENSDKLAQRNLQVTYSGNPSFPATHRIPQTFDIRPSPPTTTVGYLLDYPDELMIDWGKTPMGAVASIYWPQVHAAQVADTARTMHPSQSLTVTDSHTLSCKVGRDMTYIPIPEGNGENFAGLITLELPEGIRVGNEFKVVVRRITSRRYGSKDVRELEAREKAKSLNWRYVVGTFQMQIPVEQDAKVLPSEENLLAVLRWRLGRTAANDRWHPILERYIKLVSERVKGFGGKPGEIKPSPHGFPLPVGKGTPNGNGLPQLDHEMEYTGKVSGVLYDRFGDFEGFFLLTEQGHEHSFRSDQEEIEQIVKGAWSERTLISVFSRPHEEHVPAWIVLRRRPQMYFE